MKTDRLHSEVASLEAVIGRLSPTSYGREQLTRLHVAARALRDMSNAEPPGETASQAVKRVAAATERFKSAVERTRQGLLADEMGGLASLSAQREQALGMVPDKYATQIASAFGKVDSQTRLQWLKQAAESADGRTLAALAEAPAFVSGIDREMLGRFLDHAEGRHAPHIAAKREQFAEDAEAVRYALQAAATVAERASSPQELKDAAAAEAEMANAETAMANAIG